MSKTKLSSFAAAALLAPILAIAQGAAPGAEKPAAAAEPAAPSAATPAAPAEAKPPPWYSTITFGGSVDAYYQVRIDAAQDAPLVGRAFDTGTGFNAGYAKLTAAMAPTETNRAGFRLDLGFGPTADVIDSAASFSSGLGGRPGTAAQYVQQAYAAMLVGPVELNVGRYVTSAGAEVIEAKDNWLYSRSLLFNLIPFTHVGARATATVLPGLALTLGVNNGWDALVGSQPAKTLQASAAYTGPGGLTAAVNLLYGKNPTLFTGAPNTTEWRTLVDAVLGASFGPLDVNLNGDWSKEAGASWYGGALMARFHLPNDVARVSARGEIVNDADGIRFGVPGGTKVYEGTLGLAIPVGTNSELRAEFRLDHADSNIFTKGTPTDTQATGTIAALAWF